MARFLSDEWLAELNGAVAFDDHLHEAASGLRLTIQQVVTRPENSERCYTIEIDDGTNKNSCEDMPCGQKSCADGK